MAARKQQDHVINLSRAGVIRTPVEDARGKAKERREGGEIEAEEKEKGRRQEGEEEKEENRTEMGIDCSWKDVLRDNVPSAWMHETPQGNIRTKIVDITLLVGEKLYSTSTRREIRDFLRNHVFKTMSIPSLQHYLALQDDPKFVTRAKEIRQTQRTAEIIKKQLSGNGEEDGEMFDEEIFDQTIMDEIESEYFAAEGADLSKYVPPAMIRKSPLGRRAMHAFVANVLLVAGIDAVEKYPHKKMFIDAANIIDPPKRSPRAMDVDGEEEEDPILIASSKESAEPCMLTIYYDKVKGKVRVKCDVTAGWARGEADIKIPYHCMFAIPGDIDIHSCDTDSIPISLLCVRDMIDPETQMVKNNIYLNLNRGETPTEKKNILDVVTLWRVIFHALSAIHGITSPIEFFVVIMLLTGCDFMPEKSCKAFYGISPAAIFNTLTAKRWTELANMVVTDGRYGDPKCRHHIELDEVLLAKFVCAVYASVRGLPIQLYSPALLRRKAPKLRFYTREEEEEDERAIFMGEEVAKKGARLIFPSEEKLSMVTRQTLFVLTYWMHDSHAHITEPLTQKCGKSYYGYELSRIDNSDDGTPGGKMGSVIMTTDIYKPIHWTLREEESSK